MSERKLFPCPQCRKPVDWNKFRWKPFCSERCKLIDLGEWFNEEHRIADEKSPHANFTPREKTE